MAIHGVRNLNKSPVLISVLDTLTTKFSTDQLTDNILNSKNYLTNSIRNKVVKKWSKDFYRSKENTLRSLSSYYSHSVLGKRKYLSLRKANQQATFENLKITNFVSYKLLVKEIQNIDIGKLHDISELFHNMKSLNGMYRLPAEFILYLAKFYLKINNWREDKLKTFKSLKQKDHESFLFAIAMGGDGAPGIGMSVLVSFINVGERLPSSKEQFLLLSGDVDEGSQVVQNSFKPLVKDLNYLESRVFEIDTDNEKKKVEFMMTELPNYMKMLSFLAAELSNSASYFSTFANVARNEVNNYKKSFGLGSEHFGNHFLI